MSCEGERPLRCAFASGWEGVREGAELLCGGVWARVTMVWSFSMQCESAGGRWVRWLPGKASQRPSKRES